MEPGSKVQKDAWGGDGGEKRWLTPSIWRRLLFREGEESKSVLTQAGRNGSVFRLEPVWSTVCV